MKMALVGMVAAAAFFADTACAVEQVWDDAGLDNLWSTNASNWSGGMWTNGNRAVFTGAGGMQSGETVDVSGAVTVAGMAFETNGYVIADADADGTLTLAGAPAIAVAPVTATAVIQEVLAGSGGLEKTGAGVLTLAATNTYTGETLVSQGVLKMGPTCPNALGAAGAGNGTVVLPGAALDINGAMPNTVNSAEPISLSGAGPDGQGALVNRGTPSSNSGFTGGVTLLGDTTVGCINRIDARSTWTGGGFVLTKGGAAEFAVAYPINNCQIVINGGYYTCMHNNALGGTDFNTIMNSGTVRVYGTYPINDHVICNGGALRSGGWTPGTFSAAGRFTLNSNIVVTVERPYMPGTNTLDLSGIFEGPGGITVTAEGAGTVRITGNANTYSGATVITAPLNLGRTNVAAGVFGSGPVTNNSTLYVDRSGSFVSSNGFFGSGSTIIRYGGEMILSGSASSCSVVRVASGGLALTNGAALKVYGRFYLSERTSSIGYPVDPTNVTASLKISDTALLDVHSFETGNGSTVAGGGMTGIVEQIGGTLRTYNWSGTPGSFPGEYDGLRIGHYGPAYGVYNLRGGTVIIDNGYRLAIATDGRGRLHQTGGEIFASEVVVNARNDSGGYGRLTLEGGVLNVGSNGITAGTGAPYLVEYGGAGGVVCASTNFASSLNATLYGTNENAITFDTTNWAVTLSGKLSGAGGLTKAGTGTLTLSGANTYSGGTRILEGSVTRTSAGALPPGGEVLFGVTPDDAGGRLHDDGDLALEGLVVGVADSVALDKAKHYTIATWGGSLVSGFSGSVLPAPWFVYYDWPNKRAQLRAETGTVFWLR